MNRTFQPGDFDGLRGEALAKRLTAMGYRRMSNRYRTVARVDREDWMLVMKTAIPAGYAAHHYRRCYSEDVIEGVPGTAYFLVPPSTHDKTGYVEVA
jgi:hypothetical protein